jgi:hypothetical protein
MWSLASVLHRSPADDDRAAVRSLYPPGPTATIFGEVSAAGEPAFGAQVVALSGGRVIASALTLPDGSYSIDGLDGGTYTIYVEPLDGPHSSVPNVACVRLGNLSGGGIYNNATLDTDLPTMFFGGNAAPTQVHVDAGAEAEVSFTLTGGANDVNPTLIGLATIDGQSISLSVGGSPAPLAAGLSQAIAVAGANLDMVEAAGIGFEDPAIAINAASLRQLQIDCNGTNIPVLAFQLTVAAGAVSGPRSLALRVGSEVSMMTGAVDVRGVDLPTPTPVATATTTQPPPTATPVQGCVGDCNGDSQVTVDEIVTMVNIALGSSPVSGCPAGDSDGSGSITVDEILTAIQNALNGCA